MLPPGIYKFWLSHELQEYRGEIPCEWDNEELIQSIESYWGEELNRVLDFREITPPFGENFSLQTTTALPLPAPEFIAPPPLVPELLPVPAYPFVDVFPPTYGIELFSSPTPTFIYPTPETAFFVITVGIILITQKLEEKQIQSFPFVPILWEPHLWMLFPLSNSGRIFKNAS